MELSNNLSSTGNYRAPSQDGWVPCTPLGCIKDSAVAYAQGCKRKREDRRLTCWGPLGAKGRRRELGRRETFRCAVTRARRRQCQKEQAREAGAQARTCWG